MPASEFEIIHDYFERRVGLRHKDVILGIGDDGAILQPPENRQLVVAIDTLVEGVHFPTQTRAQDIGWKSLAVNLSDLAAMGAEPAWFTLALTMPESSADWLVSFSAGLFELADQYDLPLVGGDTTRGPLTISIQVAGYVPQGKAMLRSGAQSGDLIYVCGSIGDAMLGLSILMDEKPLTLASRDSLLASLNRPQPRISEALLIRDVASSAIDVSDGLLSDLAHLLEAGGLGAELDYNKLPFSATAWQVLQGSPRLLGRLLNGGDDYALCFCIPANERQRLEALVSEAGSPFSCIGWVSDKPGIRCRNGDGKLLELSTAGYEHFK